MSAAEALCAEANGTENTPRAVATADATTVWRTRLEMPDTEACKEKRLVFIVGASCPALEEK
jgi:hypothetical protein